MDEGDCRHGKAVIGEKSKRRLVEEFKEPENGNISYRKRGDKADGNHGEVAAAEIRRFRSIYSIRRYRSGALYL